MIGLAGVVIKSHGGADRLAFANAVRVAIVEARKGVPAQIGALVARFEQSERAASVASDADQTSR
jgi:glycerol-3-phosphate acyltransferase PlsX